MNLTPRDIPALLPNGLPHPSLRLKQVGSMNLPWKREAFTYFPPQMLKELLSRMDLVF
jgi:hypothetical protein